MNICIKAATLALVMAATGATAAMAGKTTTPNTTAPAVATTITISITPMRTLSQAEIDEIRQGFASIYNVSSDRIVLLLNSYR